MAVRSLPIRVPSFAQIAFIAQWQSTSLVRKRSAVRFCLKARNLKSKLKFLGKKEVGSGSRTIRFCLKARNLKSKLKFLGKKEVGSGSRTFRFCLKARNLKGKLKFLGKKEVGSGWRSIGSRTIRFCLKTLSPLTKSFFELRLVFSLNQV